MHKTGPVLWITAAILLALALALGIGGVWLIALGGSWYYAVAAMALLVTGILLLRREPLALWVYAAFTLGTLAWALYEVGFDWWALAPRGGLVILLGIWLALPFVRNRLVPAFGDHPPSAWRGGGLALVAALVASGGVAAFAMTADETEVRGSFAANGGPGGESDVPAIPPGEWHAYGRTDFGQRYSPLAQITPDNVGRLQVAWHYHTGDVKRPGDPVETTYQVTPLKIGSRVYLCTPHNIAIALDAASGEEVWRYDPGIEPSTSRQHQTCRGVSYHVGGTARGARAPGTETGAEAAAEAPTAQPGGATGDPATETPGAAEPSNDVAAAVNAECPRRIYLPTADARLIALNADTGEVCTAFAENGWIDLSENMPHWEAGFYYSTSPPVIADGIIVVGGAVNDNVSATEPSGVIRGYDADTGEIVWDFDPGNPDLTAPLPPGETYTENSPNAWSILSADEELGLVYVPLGNAPPDQFGGNRTEVVERFSSSVVALDLRTGALRWVFQTVHHDLWDYDVPSQPTLVDLTIGGETVPALVQPTKQGEIFVLNRATGEPVLPVEERPVPQGAADGDHTAATQPVSALSFDPPALEGRDMWGATLLDQLVCRIQFQQAIATRAATRRPPPGARSSIRAISASSTGAAWRSIRCARSCSRRPPISPSSRGSFRASDPERNYVSEGKPGLNENLARPTPFISPPSPRRSPACPARLRPWGYVAGADLTTGETVWMHRNGTVRDRFFLPLPLKMGVPDLGGPLVTAGGVAFVSGTIDYYVRAYDVSDGEQLWESRLPAGGQATPMTYEEGGRQYLLVVAGGHGSLETKTGDSVIAYTLN